MSKEQSTNQRCDVQPIRIGIRQDTNLLIAQTLEIVTGRVNTQRHRDVMHFLGGKDLFRVHFPGIQNFPAQREDRLERAITRLLCRATGGVALNEKQLTARRVFDRTIGKFAR